AEAHTILAESLFRQGDDALAEEMVEAAIRYNDRNAWPFVWLALARNRRRNVQGAARAFESALGLRGFDPEIQAYHAYWRAETGGSPESEKTLERLAHDNPRDALVWTLLGDVRRG